MRDTGIASSLRKGRVPLFIVSVTVAVAVSGALVRAAVVSSRTTQSVVIVGGNVVRNPAYVSAVSGAPVKTKAVAFASLYPKTR